jgi:thymidylate kinase
VKIAIVGPCSAGKTTLAQALSAQGFEARAVVQEHSFAPAMWQKISAPDVLIFLDVTFEVAQQRRWLNWQPADLAEQRRRLAHARDHCDLYLHTDALTPGEVRDAVLGFIASHTGH